MTTYTFSLPKKNKNTISANTYKESLADKILNAYPWLDSKKDTKKEIIDLYMISNPIPKFYTANDFLTNKYNLESEFFNALTSLSSYAKDYDFKDEFGTPIRIFDNFVQIGYEVIPITPGSLNYLKPKTKKTIIDITVKIKNGWC